MLIYGLFLICATGEIPYKQNHKLRVVIRYNDGMNQLLRDGNANCAEKDSIKNEIKDELINAVANGNTGRINRIATKCPESVNIRDNYNRPLLFIAIERNQISSLKRLVELDADICATDNYGQNALHIAAMRNRNEMVEYLVGVKAPFTRDNMGRTPSYWPQRNRNKAIIDMLRVYEPQVQKSRKAKLKS